MIKDLYKFFQDNEMMHKRVGAGYLIVEYKCLVDTELLQLFSELNFIVFIVSGRKDWIALEKSYEGNAGDAFFLRKGAYTARQHFEVENCVLLFFMDDDFIRNFMIENRELLGSEVSDAVEDQIFKLDVDIPLNTLFYSIFNYLKSGRDIPRNLVDLKFKELLFNIILNSKHKSLMRFFHSLKQVNKTNLDDVMLKNFQYDLQLEEFARLCGRSLSTFKRDFKSFYKETPGKWLKDKRLAYAKALLLNSDMNMNEICYKCGFKNTTHFNKAFKDKYQLPPKQFRSISQKNKLLAS